jgi:hypothetical protein
MTRGRRVLLSLVLAGALGPSAVGAQPAPLKGAAGKPPPERRVYVVDDAQVRLPPPDGLSDEELTEFLRAIKRGAVVWRARQPQLRPLHLGEIDFVGVSDSPRVYHVFVVPPNLVATTYVYDAEFEGDTVTIVRWAPLKR